MGPEIDISSELLERHIPALRAIAQLGVKYEGHSSSPASATSIAGRVESAEKSSEAMDRIGTRRR